MNPKSILITGANRGLGFEMVRQVLAKYQANFIFATYRTEDTAKVFVHLIHDKLVQITDFDEIMRNNKSRTIYFTGALSASV
jgi:NAD(P)-dependent dehydrogenase (short-subunit alcohol dehydrogenase family)